MDSRYIDLLAVVPALRGNPIQLKSPLLATIADYHINGHPHSAAIARSYIDQELALYINDGEHFYVHAGAVKAACRLLDIPYEGAIAEASRQKVFDMKKSENPPSAKQQAISVSITRLNMAIIETMNKNRELKIAAASHTSRTLPLDVLKTHLAKIQTDDEFGRLQILRAVIMVELLVASQ
jgi:hypothetical protein